MGYDRLNKKFRPGWDAPLNDQIDLILRLHLRSGAMTAPREGAGALTPEILPNCSRP